MRKDNMQHEIEAMRERLDASEAALAQERTLLQKLGSREKRLHEAAHKACLAWETNRSLHEVRMAYRVLRNVLNTPNGKP